MLEERIHSIDPNGDASSIAIEDPELAHDLEIDRVVETPEGPDEELCDGEVLAITIERCAADSLEESPTGPAVTRVPTSIDDFRVIVGLPGGSVVPTIHHDGMQNIASPSCARVEIPS